MVTRVCCFYTHLFQPTKDAFDRHYPDVEYVHTNVDDPWAYWKELYKRWGQGDDLIVVEQDLEITAETIPSLTSCNEAWCSYGYSIFCPPYDMRVDWALGCVKFSAGLQAGMDFMKVHNQWLGLDERIAGQLYWDQKAEPHVHGTIKHHHNYALPNSGERQRKAKYGYHMPQPGTPAWEACQETERHGNGESPIGAYAHEIAPVLFPTVRDSAKAE